MTNIPTPSDSDLAPLLEHFQTPDRGVTRVALHTEWIWALYVFFVAVSERRMFRYVVEFFDHDGEAIQRLESPFRFHSELAARRAGRELAGKLRAAVGGVEVGGGWDSTEESEVQN